MTNQTESLAESAYGGISTHPRKADLVALFATLDDARERSVAVDRVAAGKYISFAEGSIVRAGDLEWRKSSGATLIDDMPDFVPNGPVAHLTHWPVSVLDSGDAEPDYATSEANATALQAAIDGAVALGMPLVMPEGVLWVSKHNVRKSNLVWRGTVTEGSSIVKMASHVHRAQPVSVSSTRDNIQKNIRVKDIIFDANSYRHDEVQQALDHGENVIYFEQEAREAAFGIASDALAGSCFLISDQNPKGKYSFYERCSFLDGYSHCVDVTAPSSCGPLVAADQGLIADAVNNYDPQPAHRNIIDSCFASGAGDDNFTTHQCAFVTIKNSLSVNPSGVKQLNSNCFEVDDASAHVTLENNVSFGGNCAIQIKGHQYLPAPYSINVFGHTAYNCRIGLEARHTGWYRDLTDDDEDDDSDYTITDEDGEAITVTGASESARNLIINDMRIVALREYATGGIDARPAVRGARIRSYENVSISNMQIIEGDLDHRKVVDGYQESTDVEGPLVQVNRGARQVVFTDLTIRGYAGANYGVRVRGSAGDGIRFKGLSITDGPLRPFRVSGTPSGKVSLENYNISGDWESDPDSLGVEFTSDNVLHIGTGQVEGYTYKQTGRAGHRLFTDDIYFFGKKMVSSMTHFFDFLATSKDGVAGDPQIATRAGWHENNQNLGEGEAVMHALSAQLEDDSDPIDVIRFGSRKSDSSDTGDAARRLNFVVDVSSDGTESGLREVLKIDAETGALSAPYGFNLSDSGPVEMANGQQLSEAIEQQEKSRVPLSQIRQVANIPLNWADYTDVSEGSWYPQGLAYDDDGWLLIHYSDYTGVETDQNIIVVYNDSYEYKSWFKVPHGGESIVATGSFSGSDLKLFKQADDNTLIELDIGSIPEKGSVEDSSTIRIDGYVGQQICREGDSWLVEQAGPDLGITTSRTKWFRFDKDWGLLGSIYIPINVAGYLNNTTGLQDYVPKIQGVAMMDGQMLLSVGGSWVPGSDGEVPPKYAHLGVTRLGTTGQPIEYSVFEADKVQARWIEEGFDCSRTENEGIYIHPVSGQIHTLSIALRPAEADAENGGIIIMSHGDIGGESWRSDQSPYIPSDLSRITDGMLPRGLDGKFQHPLTGTTLTTMSEILDLMSAMELRHAQFFTAAHGIEPLDTLAVPATGNYWVAIENINNISFSVVVRATTTWPFAVEEFQVYQSDDVWVARLRGAPIGVDELPDVSIAGRKALVNDATSATAGEVAIGGGTNLVQVFSNGTDWIIG